MVSRGVSSDTSCDVKGERNPYMRKTPAKFLVHNFNPYFLHNSVSPRLIIFLGLPLPMDIRHSCIKLDFMCCTVTNYIFGSICCDFYEQLHSNHELIYRVMKKLLKSSYVISGFGVMGEVGNYRISNHAETSSPTNGLTNHADYSSGTAFSTRFMPSIPENGDGNIGTIRAENGNNSRDYDSALLEDCWNVSPFNSMKRNRDGDLKMFSSFNGLLGNEVVLLVFLLVFMLFACT